jgi:hypothetical protein
MSHWTRAYIGIPFTELGRSQYGCDCWGLARLVYAQELGIDLPSYVGGYASTEERAEIAGLIGEAELQGTGDYVSPGDVDKKVRAELRRRPGFAPESTIWASFEILLPSLAPPSWCLVMQAHQGGPVEGIYPGNPPLSIVIEAGELRLRRYVQGGADPDEGVYDDLAVLPVAVNQWHRVDLYTEFSNGAAGGRIKLWVDKVQLLDWTGVLGYTRTDNVSIKLGPYRGETPAERAGAKVTFAAEYRNIRIEDYAFVGAMS